MTEFGLLFLLWRRALDGRALPAAVIAIAYAASDEYHQSLVGGRHGAPVDVLIDATGVALAYVLLSRLTASRARSR
jgi:VanZ family protein